MAWLQLIQRELAGQAFVEMDRVLDRDALALGVEQCLDGQPAASFTECHHDPMRPGDRPQAAVQRAHKRHAVFEHASRLSRLHQVEDSVPTPLSHLLGDGIGESALTQDKNIFNKRS